jgi:acyl-CoA reductase-like NAD-dependent aldehyde dehydrogenase
VSASVAELRAQRELLATLLVWEIGKPWRLACADVDRALDGVDWYLSESERQLEGRLPLVGPMSNIASWNYPMSVQVHAELIQLLAGNAVIAKTPSQGGFYALSVAHAVLRRAGLPVTLLSGLGGEVGDPLLRGAGVGGVMFVGGRANGRRVATAMADTSRRYLLEQEGLNTWGIWNFSDWNLLESILAKGFEYGKQRCTAYPRFVVQRRLLPAFLERYFAAISAVRVGNPLLVERPTDPLPELHVGPLIHREKVQELERALAAPEAGATLVRRTLDPAAFLDGQDRTAYMAPACVLNPSPTWPFRHREPFGPIDSIVVVDSEEELLAEMNLSNGALVASIATDDSAFAERLRPELRAFKVGVNAPRSRGDRDEAFGGWGASWKGAFVGGDHLVQALTRPADGRAEQLFGNFGDYARLPPR